MLWGALLFLTPTSAAGASAVHGVAFDSGDLSSPHTLLGSTASLQSLQALAQTGATDVRLQVTWYQNGWNATSINPITTTTTPLQTSDDIVLATNMHAASKLGLKVTLSLRLDFDWDNLTFAGFAPWQVSPSDIGSSFSAEQWTAWFASYTNFALHHATLCTQTGISACARLVVADTLDTAYTQEAAWRKLFVSVRAILSANTPISIVASYSQAAKVSLWVDVDEIWVDVRDRRMFAATYDPISPSRSVDVGYSVPYPYVPFGKRTAISLPAPPGFGSPVVIIGLNTTVAECALACDVGIGNSGACTSFNYNSTERGCYLYAQVSNYTTAVIAVTGYTQKSVLPNMTDVCSTEGLSAAWSESEKNDDQSLQKLSAKTNKKVILVYGAQSRPFAHRSPKGVFRPGLTDCSCWNRCYDMECQANYYDAFLTYFHDPLRAAFFAGSFASGWKNDPTEGGTSDSSFTPRGKSAEAVLRRHFGVNASYPPVDPFLVAPLETEIESKEGGRALARRVREAVAGPSAPPVRNGFVFGSGEWSYPGVQIDSEDAFKSIDNAVAIGTNALEFMVTWYFNSKYDTQIFPVEDTTSPLFGGNDDQLVNVMKYAKQKHNLTVAFTPFLDPLCNDYKLCAKGSYDYVRDGTVWRGEMCQGFNHTQWLAWFEEYTPFILRYAKLSQMAGADEYLISHELVTCERDAPNELWMDLLGQVRQVFKGQVSAALNWGPFVSSNPVIIPEWILGLDYIGIDCYFDLPGAGSDGLPWQTPPLQKLIDAWQNQAAGGNISPSTHLSWLASMQTFSEQTGNKVLVCTEVGYQSKPHSWMNPAGNMSPDPLSTGIASQDINTAAQALAYQALFETLYPNKWFGGFYLWLWRADPTTGGPSDDDFGPQGKPETMDVLRQWWK